MGGSTGTLSFVKSNPVTTTGERDRNIDSTMGSLPGPQETVKTKLGTITKVHPDKPLLIWAYDANGHAIVDGWVRLLHSVEELRERWGTVKIGDSEVINIIGSPVQVTLTGLTGEDATAIICGDPDQPASSTEVSLACYAIYQG